MPFPGLWTEQNGNFFSDYGYDDDDENDRNVNNNNTDIHKENHKETHKYNHNDTHKKQPKKCLLLANLKKLCDLPYAGFYEFPCNFEHH